MIQDNSANASSINSSLDAQNNHQINQFYTQPYRLLLGLALVLLSTITAVGNGMVLHAIRTEKRLQTVSNMFIMSLAIADLIVGIIVMPISSFDFIADSGQGWKFGRGVCLTYLSIDYTASTASIFNLFILSLDRYWSITSPLRYLRRRTKRRALLMIGLAWLASSTWVVPVLGWHYVEFDGVRQNKDDVCKTEFAGNVPFKVITAIFNFYIPTTFMVVLYVKIFLAIKRRSKEMEKMTAFQGSGDTGNDSLSEDDDVVASSSKKRVSNSSRYLSLSPGNIRQDSFNSVDHQRLCGETLHVVKDAAEEDDDVCSTELEFQGLTILTFLQSSLVQSMSLSHKEISPVSQYHGLQVSVEYVENKTKWPSEEAFGDRRHLPCSSDGPRRHTCDHNGEDGRHQSHLQCYRSTKHQPNGDMIRSKSDNRIDYGGGQGVKSRNSSNNSFSSVKPLLGTLFKTGVGGSRSKNGKVGKGNKMKSHVLAKEKKAATQLGVIVGAFIFCWLPYFILFMVVAYCDSYPRQCSVPYILEVSTTWCGYLNSTLNPILYPLCNNNFKIAFKRMLRRNSSNMERELAKKTPDHLTFKTRRKVNDV